MSTPAHTNALAGETSPYLLQHAHNPVDWHPWGKAALEQARQRDRPILLSIGYAACHWCHVMERESFEDEATARLMNELFVCIKVDREERPDLDDIYMQAVQMMTGHGGWPLTVFLTPDLEPFYGGTYFPPQDRPGMPGFCRLLASVAESFSEQRREVDEIAAQLRRRLQPRRTPGSATELLGHDLVHRAAMELHDQYDPKYGGFGPAPKFPHSTSISLLLRYAWQHHDEDLLQEAVFTLEQMAGGGIYDHVGGGFHRYSTDARWLVPHFEKMLYDNALLAVTYLQAYQITTHDVFATVARETLDWVLRDMQSPQGGYYSTLDADSEGTEGKYYVWQRDEIIDLLGDQGEAFCAVYDVSAGGNWEGAVILNRPKPLSSIAGELELSETQLQQTLERGRERLRAARRKRVPPGLDDKILVDWNGLMIAAMAFGYRVLGNSAYLESAIRAAEFVGSAMIEDGRLLHTHRAGQTRLLAYLDGYAAMLGAYIELFEATFEPRWLRYARDLADGLIDLFWDHDDGGFFFTGTDHESLIARSKSAHDGATPAGNALAASWLQRLAALSGEQGYADRAREVLYCFAPQARRMPSGFGQLLLALQSHLAERREIVVVGSAADARTRDALGRLWRRYAPTDLVVLLDPEAAALGALLDEIPLLEGKLEAASGPGPSFFVCRNFTCQAPTTDLDAVLE